MPDPEGPEVPTSPGSASHRPLPPGYQGEPYPPQASGPVYSEDPRPPYYRSRVAEMTDAAGGLVKKVGALSTEQSRTVVLIFLTLFVCGTSAGLLWLWNKSSNDNTALLVRTFEAQNEMNRKASADESERNRLANAAEAERNRQQFDALSKMTQNASSENTKLIIASHTKLATELANLQQVVEKLNKKLGNNDEPATAPYPRIKGSPAG